MASVDTKILKQADAFQFTSFEKFSDSIFRDLNKL